MKPGYTFFHAMVDALEQDRLTLPTLPEVALRAGRMSRSDEVTAAQLGAEIGRDAALATGVMRIANGTVYFGERQVRTLQQAVTRLGLKMTGLVVGALGTESLYRSPSPTLAARLRRSRANAIEVAALSRTVARRFSRQDPEEAMLAGLLHEVGILPIVAMAAASPEHEESPEALEEVILQLSPRIGRRLLGEWHFPDALSQVPLLCTDFEREHAGPADLADIVGVALLHERSQRADWLGRIERARVRAYGRLAMDPEIGIPPGDGFEEELRETTIALGA